MVVIAYLVYKVDYSNANETDFYFKKEDIYYEYQAAKQIQQGENPYKRILTGNMIDNDKYVTMHPTYYYSLAFIRELSSDDMNDFFDNYRFILYLAHIAGGLIIYLIFSRMHKKLLGFTAAIFYMFNVWSLQSFIFLKQDMIAIAFLLLSFYFFYTKRFLAYILFGVSLGIKHIGVFALPLYLTPIIFKEDTLKKFLTNILGLGAILLIPALPFLVDSAESFINSMLFSVTRVAGKTEYPFGYTNIFSKFVGEGQLSLAEQLLPRLPLFIVTILNLVLLFLRRIPRSFYLFTSILIFATFNPVIFPQYITWITPLAIIGVSDYFEKDSKF